MSFSLDKTPQGRLQSRANPLTEVPHMAKATGRSEEVIDIDSGPRVPKMYRLAVEYLAESQGVPMGRVYQDALDALMADFEWTLQGLRDYYGRRSTDLNAHMAVMKERGIKHRRIEKAHARRAA
jgi:hypothetical protein